MKNFKVEKSSEDGNYYAYRRKTPKFIGATDWEILAGPFHLEAEAYLNLKMFIQDLQMKNSQKQPRFR